MGVALRIGTYWAAYNIEKECSFGMRSSALRAVAPGACRKSFTPRRQVLHERRIGHGKHGADAILFILHYFTSPHKFDDRVSKCQKSHASANTCASSSSAARSSSPNPLRSAQSMSMMATTCPQSAHRTLEQQTVIQNDKEASFLPFHSSRSAPQSRSCSLRRTQCAPGTSQRPQLPA